MRKAPLRKTPAYAKGGRERYGWSPDLRAQVDSCLAEANEATDATRRAARLYLDICFLHPFEDGNARAARLALEWVLTGAGLALHAAEPLFVIDRSVTDARDVYLFWRAVDQLTGRR